MKKLLYFLLIPFVSFAQNSVDASSIIDDIVAGNNVSISDAKITGTLDFTNLPNMEKKGSNEFESVVEVAISFKNCVFEKDVIAYYNTEKSGMGYGKTYTTNFEEKVAFENCKFEGASEFKYSSFEEEVNFEGTYFSQSANFKYAKFKEKVVFGNVDFRDNANFKYAKFKADADFYQDVFGAEADFKYAEFNERATFKRSVFSGLANFKYANFDREGVFVNAEFQNESDFKYTKGKVYKN